MPQAWFSYPISHGYIPNYDPNVGDTPHFADDLATPFHTPITALLTGTVKRASYTPWGSELFIQPDTGGMQYYYYHLDELDVHPGQHVLAGQVVGLSGGENPGFPGALHPTQPRYSTGPHTHVGWFQQSVNTPIGMEPFGPDITPLLKNVQVNQNTAPIVQNAGVSQFFSLFPNSTDTANSTPNVFNIPGLTTDVLYRAVFFLIGIIFVWIGLKHFTGSQSIVVEEPTQQQNTMQEEPEAEEEGEEGEEGEEKKGEGEKDE